MAVLTRDQAQATQATPLSVITRDEIRSLLETTGRPCVSLFMPTYRAGKEVQQNHIRYKNLLRSAEERLREKGMGNGDLEGLLEPARRLVDDHDFWQHQNDGLAVFLSPDTFRTYRLPIEFDEHLVVENRFHLTPLFSLLSGDGHFHIVALSLNSIRLISASRHSAREIDDLPGVPRSFDELWKQLDPQYSRDQPGTHAAGKARTVARSPIVMRGHGAGEDNLKAEFVQFFNLADKALLRYMDRDSPVVLAGVENMLRLYRETTEHPRVLEEGLTGNAEALSPEELRDKAWEIVEPVFLEDRRRAAGRYGDLSGTGRSTSRIAEILPAAHDGRVDSLFVARGVRLWGTYDPQGREVRLAPEQEQQSNGHEDLLDLAAVQTFVNGGMVYAVDQQDVPDGQAVAAIFRY